MNLLTVGIREGKTINYSDVREMLIPIPPLEEQREIANYLYRIDVIVAKKKMQLERLEALKQSMIEESTTGKKEAK